MNGEYVRIDQVTSEFVDVVFRFTFEEFREFEERRLRRAQVELENELDWQRERQWESDEE